MGRTINLNDTSPAAPSGTVNVKWQLGASSGTDPNTGLPVYPVSANVGKATVASLGIVQPDGSSITILDGVISAEASLVAPVLVNTGAPGTVGLEIEGSSAAAIAAVYIQSAFATGGPTSVAFTSNVTAGSAILVVCQAGHAIFGTTVNDTLGNTYSQVQEQIPGGGFGARMFVALNSPGGANTITCNDTVGGASWAAIFEYAEVAPSSAQDGNNGSAVGGSGGGATLNTGSMTTTETDLVFTCLVGNGGLAGGTGASGFVGRLSNGVIQAADNVSDAVGTISATWDTSITGGTYYAVMIMALKLSSSVDQTADLVQFKNHSGTVLSTVNNVGQFVMAQTSGAPTNVPTGPGCAFDPATNKLWIYGTSGWKSTTLS